MSGWRCDLLPGRIPHVTLTTSTVRLYLCSSFLPNLIIVTYGSTYLGHPSLHSHSGRFLRYFA